MGVSAALAVIAVGSAVTQKRAQDKAREDANRRAAEELKLRKALADQSKAPVLRKEGTVELQSEQSLEDEEIKLRSKKNRLRVGKTSTAGISTGGASVGTGLKVG